MDDRGGHAAALVQAQDQLGRQRALAPPVADEPLRDHRPVLGLVVAQVGADRAVPVDLARLRARTCASCGPARPSPPRACAPTAAARCPPPPAGPPAAPPRRLASGSASRRLISVAARCTSGVTFSSTSGSSSSRCSPSRSIASCCTTRTTPDGKCERSSPSQRATVGADPLRSPPRSPYTASSAPSIPRSVALEAHACPLGVLPAEHQPPSPQPLLSHRAASRRSPARVAPAPRRFSLTLRGLAPSCCR